MIKGLSTGKHLLLLLISVSFFSFVSIAQVTTKTLKIPQGKSSVSASGAIKGYASHDYKVSLSQGQSFKVTMKSNKGSNYFNILPPGSTDEALFNGSINGNSFSGVASTAGVYTVRVYLERNAARQNVTANYTLTVEAPGSGNSTGDAKVAGTQFNATGKVRSYTGNASNNIKMADFGVIRSGANKASVHLTYPGGMIQVVNFKDGEWTCGSKGCNKLKFERLNGGEWKVVVDDYTTFFIPDEVINGG